MKLNLPLFQWTKKHKKYRKIVLFFGFQLEVEHSNRSSIIGYECLKVETFTWLTHYIHYVCQNLFNLSFIQIYRHDRNSYNFKILISKATALQGFQIKFFTFPKYCVNVRNFSGSLLVVTSMSSPFVCPVVIFFQGKNFMSVLI